MNKSAIEVRAEHPEDLPLLENLAERAFGPGRYARTAHRVREEAGSPVAELSLCATSNGKFIGSVRFYALSIDGNEGALMLGPLMVEPEWAGKGAGSALIKAGLEAAGQSGYRLVILVGDLSYFERFGFKRVPPGQIRLNGPVDRARLLAVELDEGALESFKGLARGISGG